MSNDFYNNEFKQQFLKMLEQQETYVYYCTVIFRKAYEMERQCGRDLCTFSNSALVALLKSLNYMSLNKYYNIYTSLYQYLTYAYKKGCTSEHPENALGGITYNSLGLGSDFYNRYYKSYEQMMSVFEAVMKNVQSLPIVRIRIMLGLVYWGFPKEDLLDLKLVDLSFTNRTVYSKTLQKPIEVPTEVVNLCIAAANTTDYIDMNGRKIQVADTDAVIKLQIKRNIKDVTVKELIANTYKMFRIIWAEQAKKFPAELQDWYAAKTFNLKDVEMCGLLYRVYLQEQESGQRCTTDAEFAKAADIKAKTTAYNQFKLYKHWKQAYNL